MESNDLADAEMRIMYEWILTNNPDTKFPFSDFKDYVKRTIKGFSEICEGEVHLISDHGAVLEKHKHKKKK